MDVREEILRKRRAGKLPGDTTSVLKSWWHCHAKWPYPTVSTSDFIFLLGLVMNCNSAQSFLALLPTLNW